jgi:hypothetical protein
MQKGDDMIRLRCSFVGVIIVMVANLSMASSDGDVDKKVARLFEISWESMTYHKTVTQYNPEVSSSQHPSRAKEDLMLQCKVDIKDPNLVLGVTRKGFLTAMTDSEKRDIEIDQQEPEPQRPPAGAVGNMPMPRSMDMMYEGLRYRRRYTQPPKVPRWRALLRKFLRIQPAPFRPMLVTELEPARLQLDLDLGVLERSGGKIRSLKGYYYALMAESVEYVDVPFEPNDQWVRLTEEVSIRFRQARNTISGSGTRYNLEIDESQSARRGLPSFSVGDILPEKMVTGRKLIKEDGEPFDRPSGLGFLPPHVGGSEVGSGSGGPIKEIRFVIAVKPKHCKIPFELKNIPLPNPDSKAEEE